MSYRIAGPSNVRGYVVVVNDIDPKADDFNLFSKISAWVRWLKQYRDVELLPLLTEKTKTDRALLPAWAVEVPPTGLVRLGWRLRTWWLNVWRHRRNVREAARQAHYFSAPEVERRHRLANPLPPMPDEAR